MESAREAGKLLMDNLHKVKHFSSKGRGDIVTEIDLRSEKLIVEKITRNFPDHSILSEERGFIDKGSKYIWMIDPIDGTINYYHASTPFRVGVCLLKDRKPVISAILNPAKDELYFAEKGQGAKLNGKGIKVSSNPVMKSCIVLTHLSSKKEPRAKAIRALENVFSKTMHMRMFGSGLAAMTYVASGRFEIFFNVKTSPWDILPGALLVEEAGGKVTDIEGKKITYDSDSVLATNGKVHMKMLELLKNI